MAKTNNKTKGDPSNLLNKAPNKKRTKTDPKPVEVPYALDADVTYATEVLLDKISSVELGLTDCIANYRKENDLLAKTLVALEKSHNRLFNAFLVACVLVAGGTIANLLYVFG